MIYKDAMKETTSDDRFHAEIQFSSGVVSRISQRTNMPTEPQASLQAPTSQQKVLQWRVNWARTEKFRERHLDFNNESICKHHYHQHNYS
jgi:hypothetical protein